jgi:hypothetical protein
MIANRLGKRLRQNLARPYVKDKSGVTAIEFAALAPVFFLLMGSTMETGLMLFTEYVLQNSVIDASRQVRTGQAQAAKMDVNEFATEICNSASMITNCESRIKVYLASADSFAELTTDLQPLRDNDYLTIGAGYGSAEAPDSYECGEPGDAVAVIATLDYNFTTPFLSAHFGNVDGDSKRRMVGISMFQNEPFPTTGGC